MVESIAELRRKVLWPVRRYNDLAGVLYGDRLSIPITRAFLALGWSPTVATLGMLAAGLAGSALLLFGDVAAFVGFLCLVLYYVLDCVDGQVARYRGCEKVVFALHDFYIHLLVKSAFFLCLGGAAVRFTGEPWLFAFGLSALLGTYFRKSLADLPATVMTRAAIARPRGEGAVVIAELQPDVTSVPVPPDVEMSLARFGRPRTILRKIVLNFDISQLIFLLAAVIDLLAPPVRILGTPCDAKLLLFLFYGVALPLDFVDHYVTYARTGRFDDECRESLRRAHLFRATPAAGARDPDDHAEPGDELH